MPLIKQGRPSEDGWTTVDDEAPLPASGAVIVPLSRWRSQKDALLARGDALGVRLDSGQRAEDIAPDLAHLQLIALNFPTFRDGRAYSTARLLRERYGFEGEIRAVGNVLRDQFLFMHRCGIDAFEVADDRAVAAWQESLDEFSVFYQPAADRRISASRLRQSRKAAE
jgi:uncharacterized protein (DUF934 family)